LAWKVSAQITGINTKELLLAALAKAKTLGDVERPEVISVSGVENVNAEVEGLERMNLITLTVAQIEVIFSNSIIEALFRSAKHNHLFQQRLESVDSVNTHSAFYFSEHNEFIPHNAFDGATPHEVYTGKWNASCVAEILELGELRIEARRVHNTTIHCAICPSSIHESRQS